MIGPAFLGRGGFTDGNDRQVESLDVVQYHDGRRGIMLEALSDGDAYVLFRKTFKIECVRWKQLCKVPEAENRSIG